ncbi:hypothetical protein QLX08_004196 [Tetragonisca angustula]|uniref:Rho guanine nucleotide exchange factor 7 n=1 Tax=Tetragonisca angustula TaxID=166442 RepID=A0AAW1A3B5_9HYME
MSKSDTPKFVTALFSFKGKNNDELCFKKGDVITITQTDDEGWWEGTLHDKTGWFPANYVKECRITDNSISTMKTSPEKSLLESPAHQNRDIVLKDLIDSERVNVAELQGLINNFLHPLESANILNKEEYKQLLGNIHEILEVHQRLLSNLETAITQDRAFRVGNLFLTLASKLKSIHTTYCGNHPTAVCILDRYRDELNDFMEHSGAISPGILVLTTGLSKPFRRLDKYSAMLQELERYTEKNHPDRGDTQRSIVVYREIADRCASIRKQRELALQILTSGIKGWEGEELSSLGEILYVGSVTLASGTTGLDRRDRYFVLFPTTLLVLSASPRMSSFVYEGKLPLTGITVTQVEDTDEIRNAFEITGPMIERILVLCATKEDQQRWIELLIQEQTSNSLVKSPTTSRVSYNLPPYARLSRYFAKLVRRKIIRPELLKKLLYLQYVLRPDMSNVKMRKTNVTTYVLHPMQTTSQDSCSHNSESFQSNKITTGQSFIGTTTLRKSTLTLDVRYALADIDLSTVGITKDSSLTELISTERRSEISKSLPLVNVGSSVTTGFINNNNINNVSIADEQASRSRFNNLARSFPIGYNMHQDTFGDMEKPINATVAMKCWKTHKFTDKQLATINSMHHPSVPVRNSNIFEHCCQTDTYPQGFGFQTNVISVGSSDSGMAESYHLNSSEINSSCKSCTCIDNNIERPVRLCSGESENDENNFEYQCVCTSPFDSIPRDSAHLSDLSKHIDNTLDPSICETASTIVYNSDHAFTTNKIQENELSNVMQRRFTQPIPYTHQTIVRKVGRKAIQPNRPVENDYNETKQIYTSGLYAHWWLKKSIPFSGCSDQDLQSTKRETATAATSAAATTTATTVTTQINYGPLCLSRN